MEDNNYNIFSIGPFDDNNIKEYFIIIFDPNTSYKLRAINNIKAIRLKMTKLPYNNIYALYKLIQKKVYIGQTYIQAEHLYGARFGDDLDNKLITKQFLK